MNYHWKAYYQTTQHRNSSEDGEVIEVMAPCQHQLIEASVALK